MPRESGASSNLGESCGDWIARFRACEGIVPRGRRCLSCPLPLRERAQGCAHDLEWVRGLREDPSPIHRLAAGSCPLPQGGEGAITSTALAAPISSQALSRGRRLCDATHVRPLAQDGTVLAWP